MNNSAFEDFKADAMNAGFDEVLERQWPPGTVLDTHSHSFGIEAVIPQGEMWLTCQGRTLHLGRGLHVHAGARDAPR